MQRISWDRRRPGFRSVQLLRLLPPRRRQRLRTARPTRLIQRLDSPTVALLVSMVVAFCHRHGLVAGEVVDLLDGDAKVQQPRDKGMAEVMGSDMAEAGSVTR